MEKIFILIFASVAIEGIIYYVKALSKKELPICCIASIGIGIFVSVNFNLDVFELLQMESNIQHAGSIMTGILLSRGSNYVFDAIGIMSEIPSAKYLKKTQKKEEE